MLADDLDGLRGLARRQVHLGCGARLVDVVHPVGFLHGQRLLELRVSRSDEFLRLVEHSQIGVHVNRLVICMKKSLAVTDTSFPHYVLTMASLLVETCRLVKVILVSHHVAQEGEFRGLVMRGRVSQVRLNELQVQPIASPPESLPRHLQREILERGLSKLVPVVVRHSETCRFVCLPANASQTRRRR